MLVVVKKHDQFTEGTSPLAWCRSIVRIEVLRAKQRHYRERSFAERLLDDAIDAGLTNFRSPAVEKQETFDATHWDYVLNNCPNRGNA
jgi:DNA-directed RNA polymerase specialized sigma24 family protein